MTYLNRQPADSVGIAMISFDERLVRGERGSP